MKTDVVKVSILEDGTIKCDTDRISLPNHSNCEQFLRETARELGGTATTKMKHKHGHTSHTHSESEEHHH